MMATNLFAIGVIADLCSIASLVWMIVSGAEGHNRRERRHRGCVRPVRRGAAPAILEEGGDEKGSKDEESC